MQRRTNKAVGLLDKISPNYLDNILEEYTGKGNIERIVSDGNSVVLDDKVDSNSVLSNINNSKNNPDNKLNSDIINNPSSADYLEAIINNYLSEFNTFRDEENIYLVNNDEINNNNYSFQDYNKDIKPLFKYDGNLFVPENYNGKNQDFEDYFFIPSNLAVSIVPSYVMGPGVLGRTWPGMGRIEIMAGLYGKDFEEVLLHEVLHNLYPQDSEKMIRKKTSQRLNHVAKWNK